MCHQHGLVRLNNDYSLFPLLAVKTPAIGNECEEFLPGYVETFRLHFFRVAGVGVRSNDGLNLGGRDLYKQ